MKILMVVSGTPHSTMTHRIVALGRELKQRGHEASMIAPNFDRHSQWQVDKPATMDGITMIYPWQLRTRSYWLNLIPYLVTASWAVLRQPADVLYVSKPTPATAVAVGRKWLRRTPLVLDMDDWGSEVMRLEGHSRLAWGLVAACERLVARQAAGVVVVSRRLEREFVGRFLARKPILRLPNGVDPAEFIPVTAQPGRRAKLIFFAMLGRTEILQAILEALPEVVQRLGSTAVHLEVLGDGPSRAELEDLTQELGLTECVTFRGWVTFDQLGRYAAAGDIGLCIMPDEPAVAAASNQKVFQYQALKLVTVVTAVGDLPEYVENGAAGVVVAAGDRQALAEALIALLPEAERRNQLGERGRALAETRYAWKVLAGRLEQFLEKVR